jgi:NitT/TauT family transport system substrate-binding protein
MTQLFALVARATNWRFIWLSMAHVAHGAVWLAVWLALALAGCAKTDPSTASAPSSTASAPRKVVLQTDWFPQAEHGGYYQALAKGFFHEAGLALEIWPGGPGAGIKLKVARGDADFGMLRSDDIILSASRGLPLVMVTATMQHDPQALMVHEASPVRTFKDLDKRAVIGNVGMTWFPFLERKFGITIEKRQNTYGLGEFFANPATIQQCVVTNEPFFAQQHGHRVRTLLLADAGYDCYQVIFTRRDLIRRSPEVVRAFVAASIRGWRDYLESDPAPAHAVILQRNREMTPELLGFSRSEMIARGLVRGDPTKGEDIGQLSEARIAAQIETLLALKILEKPVQPGEVATKEFLPAPESR